MLNIVKPDMISRGELEFEQWSTLVPAEIDLDGIDFQIPTNV